ncbi:unnamed protein product [Agarophyton chilense]
MSAPHFRTVSSALQRAQSLITKAFTYDLPQSQIATHPLPDRSSSKLLVVARGRQPSHAKFNELPNLLPKNSLLLLNSSRVIPARLRMRKPSGGKAEILLLNHVTDTTAQAMHSPLHGQRWRALIGGKNIRVGHVLHLMNSSSCSQVEAHVIERHQNHAVVDFQCPSRADSLRAVEFLNQEGSPPLPPYMKRPSIPQDTETYQTVYASEHGSVAAPTAGLHITDNLLDDIQKKGIRTREIVLHIGIGTFQQIETPIAGTHDMHEESLSVSGRVIAEIWAQLRNRAPIVAVGTTCVRTVESLYWFGVRLIHQPEQNNSHLAVGQWEPYEVVDKIGITRLPDPEEALGAVLDWCGGSKGYVHGRTKLMIVPGYPRKMIDALITNFHQPRSTLLMLVSAFHGGEPDELVSLYQHALEHKYRFLSYGDSSIYATPEFFEN